MSVLNEKLVFLNDGKMNVYKAIKTFIERKAQSSTNTAEVYHRHIRDFFQTMRGKSLEQLTEEDLIFTKMEIEQYQVELRKKYKASTVNNTISSLRSLYSKLKDYGFAVDPDWFALERYKESDKESYDVLTHEEIVQMIDLVGETRKGFEKQLLIRVAYATAFRLNAILNLKWSDLKQINGYWTLSTVDKGSKKDIKKISNNLYQDLMKLKEMKPNSEYIFNLQKKTINDMMDYIRSIMDFGDRTITFHSIRKASITQVGILTNGSVKAMQRHGNHANASTTLNSYVKNVDLDEMVIVDVDLDIDFSIFDNMSKSELIKLIKSMDYNTKIKLYQKAKTMETPKIESTERQKMIIKL